MGRRKKNVEEKQVEEVKKIPKKRGRKPKKKVDTDVESSNKNSTTKPKKRGRKPKGGKIIHKSDIINKNTQNNDSNIILHLKCKSKDLGIGNCYTNSSSNFSKIFNSVHDFKPFDSFEKETIGGERIIMGQSAFDNKDEKKDNEEMGKNQVSNAINADKDKRGINNEKNKKSMECDSTKCESSREKLWEQLNKLKKKLHLNLFDNENRSCFHCTYDFNTPSIYLPKQIKDDKYEVYG